MNGVRLVMIVSIAALGFVSMDAIPQAQLPVPIGLKERTPLDLDFRGKWPCSDGNSAAQLLVLDQHNRESPIALSPQWTGVAERQEGISLHYFVGFNPENKELLMVDSGAPTLVSYATKDQWDDYYNGRTFAPPFTPNAVAAQTSHSLRLLP